jgi:hypothetical protein
MLSYYLVPLTLNNEDSEYKLSRSIPAGLRSYLLEIISDFQWEKGKRKSNRLELRT